MTAGYLAFMTAMTAAWILMVVAWIRMIRFFNLYKQPEQNTLNPLDGLALWKQFFFDAGAFGEEAEPKRIQITRTYLLALGSFVLAIVLFLTLPGIPSRPA